LWHRQRAPLFQQVQLWTHDTLSVTDGVAACATFVLSLDQTQRLAVPLSASPAGPALLQSGGVAAL